MCLFVCVQGKEKKIELEANVLQTKKKWPAIFGPSGSDTDKYKKKNKSQITNKHFVDKEKKFCRCCCCFLMRMLFLL
jgi:hypothetical protein